MAIKKSNIDFDVYERQDSASLIDWSKAAADITKSFKDVADDREKRKADIDKAFRDQQAAAADMGEYNDVTLQQYVINGGQKIANYNQDMYNLVKKGIVKPSEFKMFQNNVDSNLTLIKSNAQMYDKAFTAYTNRTQNNENAALERYQAGLLEGFASLNNLELEWDPMTGEAVNLRIDPQTGEPIEGESMTVQNMNVMLKQQYNAYDADAQVAGIKGRLGNIIEADIRASKGNSVAITEIMRSRAETEFFATEKGKETLRLEAESALTDPVGKQDLLAGNPSIMTEQGEQYRVGSVEEYDKWNKENPGNEKNNPILRAKFENGRLAPEFNEFQDKAATDYMMKRITGTLDVKETKRNVNLPTSSTAQIQAGGAKKEAAGTFNTLRLVLRGSGAEAEAAADELVTMYNKNKGKDEPTIRRIDRLDNGQVRVIYTDGEDRIVGQEGGTLADAERTLYSIIQSGTDLPQTYDGALSKFDLERLEGNVVTGDPLSGYGSQTIDDYQEGIIYQLEDGKYVAKKLEDVVNFSTESFGFYDKGGEELATNFTEVIETDGFLPPQFKVDLQREGEQMQMTYDEKTDRPVFRIIDAKGNPVKDGEGKVLEVMMTQAQIDSKKPEEFAMQIQGVIKRKHEDIKGRFKRSENVSISFTDWKKDNPGGTYVDYLDSIK